MQHPLIEFASAQNIPLATIAEKAGVSRMTLYRLVKGQQNATIGLLERVSAATDGAVPVSAFLPTPTDRGAT